MATSREDASVRVAEESPTPAPRENTKADGQAGREGGGGEGGGGGASEEEGHTRYILGTRTGGRGGVDDATWARPLGEIRLKRAADISTDCHATPVAQSRQQQHSSGKCSARLRSIVIVVRHPGGPG